MELLKAMFNQAVAMEANGLYRFNYDGKIGKFDKVAAFEGILCKKGQGEY